MGESTTRENPTAFSTFRCFYVNSALMLLSCHCKVLGNVYDADNKKVLLSLNVGYIINVSEHISFKFEKDFKYFRVPAKDNTGANLTTYFNGAFEFIGKIKSAIQLGLLLWIFIELYPLTNHTVPITVSDTILNCLYL